MGKRRSDLNTEELLAEVARAPAAAIPDVSFGGEDVRVSEPAPRLALHDVIAERFEIEGPLGSGGAGEVYRARDRKLGRAVAIKVLAIDEDAEHRRRFEQEARLAGSLNHPNIVAIHDVGDHGGAPYLVMELLEGTTLRGLIAEGGLPARDAVEHATQIANGLAAAHDAGLVHRDLKPENILVCTDGRIKIVDFGLAKVVSGNTDITATDQGRVVGTVGYMAPEQVRGEAVDHRSDVFAFGAIVVELLTGVRVFAGRTSGEIMSAILRDPPRGLDDIPPALARIARRCLDKRPERRFQSVHDLAFALGELRPAQLTNARTNRSRWLVVGAAGIAVTGAVAVAISMRSATGPSKRMTVLPAESAIAAPVRMTYRRGTVTNARFAMDPGTLVYAAAWDGQPLDVFVGRPNSFEGRSLGLGAAEILAISSAGEMALKTRIETRSVWGLWSAGTLARAPLAGGAPRPLAEHVTDADWTPGGELVVSRIVDGEWVLEWPIGHEVYRTQGWLSQPRVSRDGTRVAFIDHPTAEYDGGRLMVLEGNRAPRVLSGTFSSVLGMGWHGDELWFTAAIVGGQREMRAVSLGGQERVLYRVPGSLRLLDIAPDGRVAFLRDDAHARMFARVAGGQRDLSWLDGSNVRALSPDGSTLLFAEVSETGGPTTSTSWLRKLDEPSAVRLGDGFPLDLSRDGAWTVTVRGPDDRRLVLVPTGTGQPRALTAANDVLDAAFAGTSKLLTMSTGRTLAVLDLERDTLTPLPALPHQPYLRATSPDGSLAAVVTLDEHIALVPLDGAAPRVLDTTKGLRPVRFTPDGHGLYAANLATLPGRVVELDLDGHVRRELYTLAPDDRAGVDALVSVALSETGDVAVANYQQIVNTLYVVDGLGRL